MTSKLITGSMGRRTLLKAGAGFGVLPLATAVGSRNVMALPQNQYLLKTVTFASPWGFHANSGNFLGPIATNIVPVNWLDQPVSPAGPTSPFIPQIMYDYQFGAGNDDFFQFTPQLYKNSFNTKRYICYSIFFDPTYLSDGTVLRLDARLWTSPPSTEYGTTTADHCYATVTWNGSTATALVHEHNGDTNGNISFTADTVAAVKQKGLQSAGGESGMRDLCRLWITVATNNAITMGAQAQMQVMVGQIGTNPWPKTLRFWGAQIETTANAADGPSTYSFSKLPPGED